jgi:AMMECR1 domain-containing protein
MASCRIALFGIIAYAVLVSCARSEVHLHDRHSLSYPLVESYAKSHLGTTLVLLDYHHDVGPIGEDILSSNWVAMLLHKKAVSRVLWVSGRDLLLPNRNARIAWLRRKLDSFPPSESAWIENHIVLEDWHALEKRHVGAPLVVSLDFDLLCNDPGTPPERFVDEVCAWMAKQRPGLVTLALSAAYESEASSAWRLLGRFVEEYGKEAGRALWFLEAGPRKPLAEGVEEGLAWGRWDDHHEAFGRRGEAFFPGAGIWIAPPAGLRDLLLALDMRPGDETAKDVLSVWRNDDLADLERRFPQAATDEALAAAAAALEGSWKGEPPILPKEGAAALGLALRIQNKGADRGCLALYRNVSDPVHAVAYCAHLAARDPRYPAVLPSERPDLELELSVFGPWRKMTEPRDFLPGLDSLLLVAGNDITLLQAPVAVERGYGREEFLARLSNKAGLGLEGWQKRGLRFMRSSTIWSRRPLPSIEAASDYQKYEKK